MKLLWSGIKTIISNKNSNVNVKTIISNKNSNVNVIGKLKAVNGNVTTNPTVIANTFHECFVNVGKMSHTKYLGL